MTEIGTRVISKVTARINQQRRSGCFLHVSDERRAYARRCMSVIVAADAAHDRRHRLDYGESVDIGGAA
jgi:hypothetical protein